MKPIKVEVKNLVTLREFAGNFEDRASADAWISMCMEKKKWGEPSDCQVVITDKTEDIGREKKKLRDALKALDAKRDAAPAAEKEFYDALVFLFKKLF